MKEQLRLLSRGMQAGMFAVVLAGLVSRNFTWIPAAALSLLVSEVPSLLRRDLKIVLPVELNFLIVFALFLHVIGGVSGFYDNVTGWDHITHALSASLVAALGFVMVVAVDKYVDSIHLPRPFLAFFIVMFTMAFGVIWELIEFVIDELTGSYLQLSLSDSMIDMLFDAFGGFVVAAAGTRYLTHTNPERFVESLQLEEAKERIARIVEKRRGAA